MKKIVLIFSLIIIAVSLYNHNNNPIPQFIEEQMQIICVQEEI